MVPRIVGIYCRRTSNLRECYTSSDGRGCSIIFVRHSRKIVSKRLRCANERSARR